MAIDYGTKRVGIASTDNSGHFALPRMVLANDETLLDHVLEFASAENIDKIVIGESKNLDGSCNPIQKEIEKFKIKLEEQLTVTSKENVSVTSHPEIFTTVEARRLQGQTDMTDASAAAIILKSYIDAQ